jgi:hypothetical protein
MENKTFTEEEVYDLLKRAEELGFRTCPPEIPITVEELERFVTYFV